MNGVVGCEGVPGENDNGDRIKELCQEKGLCIANTYFKHRDIHKYTWYRRTREGEILDKSLIDFVLVSKSVMNRMKDVRAVRGMSADISDHVLVLCKCELSTSWNRKARVGGRKERILVEKLENDTIKREYQEKLARYIEVDDREGNVCMKFQVLNDAMQKAAGETCGRRKIGGVKKGSHWWNDVTKRMCEEKRELYLRSLDENMTDEERILVVNALREKNKEVKRVVRRSKKAVNEEFGQKRTTTLGKM